MATKERISYINEYKRTHLKRIGLEISKADYEILKAVADKLGLPVNTYIKRAIKTQIEIDSEK